MNKDPRIVRIKQDMKMGPLFVVGWLESFFLNPVTENPAMTREDYDKMIDSWEEWNEHFKKTGVKP